MQRNKIKMNVDVSECAASASTACTENIISVLNTPPHHLPSADFLPSAFTLSRVLFLVYSGKLVESSLFHDTSIPQAKSTNLDASTSYILELAAYLTSIREWPNMVSNRKNDKRNAAESWRRVSLVHGRNERSGGKVLSHGSSSR